MSEQQIDDAALAAERNWRRIEFTGHAFLYLVGNALIVVFWAAGTREGFWPGWILLGWGLVLAFDAWRTFAPVRRAPRGERRPVAAQSV